MEGSTCLNCKAHLADDARFCANCGQTRDVHRFTMGNFFHEVFHAFTHTDKGIFHLLKSLATKPGTTAREYINGRRKHYFNPFTFFLILMGIFVLSNNFFVKPRKEFVPDIKVLQHIPTEEGRQNYIAVMERVTTSSNFFRKNGNVVAMIAVPFISLFTWLFFRRKKYNYAEHLTANMMFVAFSNLVFTFIIFPLGALLDTSDLSTFLALLLQVFYFAWSLNGFLELNTSAQRTKSFFVAFLAILLWSVFTIA
ncbi:MAG: DUF3667 domain-containing protein, partial [Sphingobacteriales bacterium]